MLKTILSRVMEKNAELLGNAALTEMGHVAYGLVSAPMKEKLPKELRPAVDSPLAKLLAVNAMLGLADTFGVLPAESMAAALANAAWDDVLKLVGKDKMLEIEATYLDEVDKIEKAKDVTPKANTSKGGQKMFHKEPSGILGIIAKSEEIKANTAKGSENSVELTEQGNDTPPAEDGPYMPTKFEDLHKTPDGRFTCPDPLGLGEHEKQRTSFRPYKNKHGFKVEFEGVLVCGGCADKMQAEDMRLGELTKKASLLTAKTTEQKELAEKLAKAKATLATFEGLMKDDPSNEDTTTAYNNQNAKVKKLIEQMDALEIEILKLDELVNGTPGNKAEDKPTAPVNVPAKTEAPANNQSKGGANAVANTRLDHIKGKHNKNKHGKK